MERDTILTVIVADDGNVKAVFNPSWGKNGEQPLESDEAATVLEQVMRSLADNVELEPMKFQMGLMRALQGAGGDGS